MNIVRTLCEHRLHNSHRWHLFIDVIRVLVCWTAETFVLCLVSFAIPKYRDVDLLSLTRKWRKCRVHSASALAPPWRRCSSPRSIPAPRGCRGRPCGLVFNRDRNDRRSFGPALILLISTMLMLLALGPTVPYSALLKMVQDPLDAVGQVTAGQCRALRIQDTSDKRTERYRKRRKAPVHEDIWTSMWYAIRYGIWYCIIWSCWLYSTQIRHTLLDSKYSKTNAKWF